MTIDVIRLLGYEALVFVLIFAIGSGVAAALPRSMPIYVRVAMAPALGLALSTSLFTTLAWFWSARQFSFVVPILAALSGGVAWSVCARRGSVSRPRRLKRLLPSALMSLILAIVVVGPITATLGSRGTVGPTTFEVYDAEGYIASIDGMLHASLSSQARQWDAHGSGPWANLEAERADYYASAQQELDQTPFEASVDALLGVAGTNTFAAFLVVYVFVLALGVAAAIGYATRCPAWSALVGGLLVGGTFSTQLYFDGSEAAICGLAVLLPMSCAIHASAIGRSLIGASVAGTLVGGLFGLYPVIVLPLTAAAAAAGGLAILWCGVRRRVPPSEAGTRARSAFRFGVAYVVLVLAVASALDPVALVRDLPYWSSLLHGGWIEPGLPKYALSPGVTPAWLLQTRGLYDLATPLDTTRWLLTLLAPLVLLVPIVLSLRRSSFCVGLAIIIVISIAVGAYQRLAHGCSYCEDRSMMPAVPCLMVLIGVGIIGLAISKMRLRILLAAAISLVAALAIGYTALFELRTFATYSYYLLDSVRAAAARVEPPSIVEMEGFNAGPNYPGESGLVYELLDERDWGDVSVPLDQNSTAFYYFNPPLALPGAQFHAGYVDVLTRFGAVVTARKSLYAERGVALERRSARLDVTVDFGMSVPAMSQDPLGQVWVAGPSPDVVRFIVTGSDSSKAYVLATFATSGTTTATGADVLASRSGPDVLRICLQAAGRTPALVSDVTLSFTANPRLIWMHAAKRPCGR
jgi:hypothetical protein